MEYTSSNKVFQCSDLRSHILSFIVNKRCMSCHQPVLEINKNNNNIKKYWSYKWQKTQCNKFKLGRYIVCNWCYYYVWEYD